MGAERTVRGGKLIASDTGITATPISGSALIVINFAATPIFRIFGDVAADCRYHGFTP